MGGIGPSRVTDNKRKNTGTQLFMKNRIDGL